MKNTKLYSFILFAFLFLAFISCENDFADFGSNIIETENFNTSSQTYPVTTFTQNIGPVQSSNLTNYLLGHFNDPVFGGSTASIVSQMSPSQFNQDLGENIVIDSIVLTIPYFSTQTGTSDEGIGLFDIDSLYGNSPIRLSIHENNFFLRDFDPNSDLNEDQLFFSNGSTSENDIIPQSQLEGTLLFRDEEFTPSPEQIILTEINDGDTIVTGRLSPSLRVKLNNPNDNFWQDLIFDRQDQPELSNLNNFNDHFRGIYINAESINNDGAMTLLDFSSTDANITIFFDAERNGIPIEDDAFTLNFSGNTVNIFNNNFIPIPQGDQVNGDSQLFLKGGEGSMAIINLFNGGEDGNSDEFNDFRNDFLDEEGNLIRLINEAFIEFQVDQSIMSGEEPNRVYIYDLNNNIPLLDFAIEQSSNELVTNHLRPLERDENNETANYRVRITNHINNLLINDSTNVKLGLVVTSNVDIASLNNLSIQNENLPAKFIPIGSILSPRGTVLFGNNAVDESKRPVFRIFFTEPNNQ